MRSLRANLLPSKLLKRVLLKLLITPRRGRSLKIHLTLKMRRAMMMTVKMVKNSPMGRRKRKVKVGRVLIEVKVRVPLNQCVDGGALLRQTKAHSRHLKRKPVKEEGLVSHKLHILFKWKFCLSLWRGVLYNPLATVFAVLLIVLNSSFYFLTHHLTKMRLRNWWKQFFCTNISFWGPGKFREC